MFYLHVWIGIFYPTVSFRRLHHNQSASSNPFILIYDLSVHSPSCDSCFSSTHPTCKGFKLKTSQPPNFLVPIWCISCTLNAEPFGFKGREWAWAIVPKLQRMFNTFARFRPRIILLIISSYFLLSSNIFMAQTCVFIFVSNLPLWDSAFKIVTSRLPDPLEKAKSIVSLLL